MPRFCRVGKFILPLGFTDDPRFIIEPSDVSGEKGQNAELICLVDGNPAPTYTWFKNGDMRHVSFSYSFCMFGSSVDQSSVLKKRVQSLDNQKVLPSLNHIFFGVAYPDSFWVNAMNPESLIWREKEHFLASKGEYSKSNIDSSTVISIWDTDIDRTWLWYVLPFVCSQKDKEESVACP